MEIPQGEDVNGLSWSTFYEAGETAESFRRRIGSARLVREPAAEHAGFDVSAPVDFRADGEEGAVMEREGRRPYAGSTPSACRACA